MDTFCPLYEDNPDTLPEIARVQILRAIGVVSTSTVVTHTVYMVMHSGCTRRAIGVASVRVPLLDKLYTYSDTYLTGTRCTG